MQRKPWMSMVWLVALASPAAALEPIPNKLVVLTFDDSAKTHYTVARPLLKRLRFGATFFITEGFDFRDNKRDYMTWDEIAELHRDGFEIGNHTRDHQTVTKGNLRDLAAQVRGISLRCREHGIPAPVSFAYPGNGFDLGALPILHDLGIKFARRGGLPEYSYKEGRGFAFEPGRDHPLLIPSAGDARPSWTLKDLERAVEQARNGRIAVLQFHGVPDTAHAWVNTSKTQFETYMNYLSEQQYKVIALRDLARYVDADVAPADPTAVIRQRRLETALVRRPANDADLRYWLENMVCYHRFTTAEVSAATGLTASEVDEALRRFHITPADKPKATADGSLLLLPYPGGRHPRIGFLDGAIRPQRETKVSVFTPWDRTGYVVVDVPEAIWSNLGLTYLAHTHVPTIWTKQGIELEPLEWNRRADGSLDIERKLANGITFGARVKPTREAVRMELWLTNGTKHKLTDLRVQNCVLLKGARGFEEQTSANKVLSSPYAACRSSDGKHWVITAWEPCQRTWDNPQCPCLHSDPKFPDCAPGQTVRVRGWLSFYQGTDLQAEFRRIDLAGWRHR
jgi:peptidoglycan/xylan/chitin deacetylase (PgdA/CDA1 family)